jgi:hypothetical protein
MKNPSRRASKSAALAGALLLALALGAAAAAAPARAPQRFLSPGTPDGVGDAAVFGSGAREVSIFDLRGRLVFHRSQEAGVPIVWNCRDRSGRIPPSGIYIARIRTAEAETVYQSFALVR